MNSLPVEFMIKSKLTAATGAGGCWLFRLQVQFAIVLQQEEKAKGHDAELRLHNHLSPIIHFIFVKQNLCIVQNGHVSVREQAVVDGLGWDGVGQVFNEQGLPRPVMTRCDTLQQGEAVNAQRKAAVMGYPQKVIGEGHCWEEGDSSSVLRLESFTC